MSVAGNWIESLTLETVIVHLKDSHSIKGVLYAVHADCVILRDAVLLEPEAQAQIGEVVIPRPNVDFLQTVRGEA